MTQVAILRCQENEERCPLTNCLRCAREGIEGFSMYDQAQVVGIFTLKGPGQDVGKLAKVLKAKGAQAIHACTCAFANKSEQGWSLQGGGFCDNVDEILEAMHKESGLPCIKGSAHLPKGYDIQKWD